jgi:hypothetical protein
MAGQRKNRGFGLAVALLALALLAPSAASANMITVDSTADPSAAGCTLHDAIMAANNNSAVNGCAPGGGVGTDTIDFSLPNPSTITLAGALPTMTSNIDITGPGMSQLTVSGSDTVRPFQNNSISVDSISGMTISHGANPNGGAINNSGTLTLTDVAISASAAAVFGGTNAFPQGGGIANTGTLHLILSVVSGNNVTANGATSQNAANGAGIFNGTTGTLTLDRSTVSGNSAGAIASAPATAGARGGGITTGGSLTATRSTISGNSVSASGGASNNGQGGGIMTTNTAGVTVALDRSTVADNTVAAAPPGNTADGGGILSSGTTGSSLTVTSSTIAGNTANLYANLEYGALTTAIKNTIIANPIGANSCSPGVGVSQGYNIDSGTSCGFNQTGDQVSTDPLLASSLADNGGPTHTLLPQPNSPAIDKGLSSGETVDQRGLQRPWLFDVTQPSGGDGTDVGAVEVQGPVPTGTTPTSPNSSGSPNVFGTVEEGSTVQLFNDGTCGTQATSGPAATFVSPGLTGGPVPAGTSMTFSVRSTYGTATSICSPTAVTYTNSSTPPPPSGGGGGPVPPDTSVSARVKRRKHKATFTFSSPDASSTFMCKLDKAAFAPCTSPMTFKRLRKGRHTFTVEAANTAGADPSPAVFSFKLKR